jgi:aminopeptidase
LTTFDVSLQKYAKLIVKLGVDVHPGQTVLIQATMEALPLVRKITKAAYQAGARRVEYVWQDDELTLTRFVEAPDDSFDEIPSYTKEMYESLVDEGAAFISVVAPSPDLLKVVDSEKIARSNKAAASALVKYQTAIRKGQVRRTAVCAATPTWAARLFPNLEEHAAYEKLWDYIFKATRVDQEDPIAAWSDHVANLVQRLEWLNEAQFKRLHYRGPGTDLHIDLPDGHIWIGGGLKDPQGVFHIPNLPTEEIFTAPKRDGVSGTVCSTKPLIYGGNTIDRFSLTFEAGKITEFEAEQGLETLKKLINMDEGSVYLGEVALVPDNSPISKTGITFEHTLYDENASCHLAVGMAYPFCVKGGVNMSPEELKQHGLNVSLVHVDFMIGSGQLDIDGELTSGELVPIFRDGNWATEEK